MRPQIGFPKRATASAMQRYGRRSAGYDYIHQVCMFICGKSRLSVRSREYTVPRTIRSKVQQLSSSCENVNVGTSRSSDRPEQPKPRNATDWRHSTPGSSTILGNALAPHFGARITEYRNADISAGLSDKLGQGFKRTKILSYRSHVAFLRFFWFLSAKFESIVETRITVVVFAKMPRLLLPSIQAGIWYISVTGTCRHTTSVFLSGNTRLVFPDTWIYRLARWFRRLSESLLSARSRDSQPKEARLPGTDTASLRCLLSWQVAAVYTVYTYKCLPNV